MDKDAGRRLRVLIVDDSAYHRRTLVKILEQDPGIDVVSTAVDGEDAIKKVVKYQPDLVTLDLEMPRMDGFTFLRWLMRSFPRPVLVITSLESNKSVFKAMDMGAIDFVIKPVKYASTELANIGAEVLTKVREIAAIRMDTVTARAVSPVEKPPPRPLAPSGTGRFDLVAVGASTGGPPALQKILADLPRGLPVAVVISQHMPAGFTRLFAERLNRLVPFKVKEAREGDVLEPGTALVAPGGKHLVIARSAGGGAVAGIAEPADRDRYIPSVDRMMLTAADVYGDRMTGVILTGMGDDGVKGLAEVRRRGGLTVAESEETCVVYGMPREAVRTGAAERVLPLDDIGPALSQACQGKE